MLYRLLADLVLILHAGFVAFVMLGALVLGVNVAIYAWVLWRLRSARLAPAFQALVPMATASQGIGRPRHPTRHRAWVSAADRQQGGILRSVALVPRVADRQPVSTRGSPFFYAAPRRHGSSSST